MELEYAKSGTRLTATLNCATEPGILKGGGVGWYEVKEIGLCARIRKSAGLTGILRIGFLG
jgi:hypothetical protein